MELLGQVSNLIVHHSASPRDSTTVEMLTQWHKDRGFETVGYHWIITADGKIHQGRLPTVKGAHCKGRNWDSWGVCVVGDNTKSDQRWNTAQESALVALIHAARTMVPRIGIYGHRDVEGHTTATECPGIDIRQWLGEQDRGEGNGIG